MPISSLEDIFNDDDLGILTPDPVKESTNKSDDQRLIDSFMEINSFFEINSQAPSMDSSDIHEHKLYSRLQKIVSEQSKM
jgi:hypothetical protein